ncbi:MAG: alpha/beta hydrolase [Chloroflexi bacterium]|nr:alpha/beta hydrolase [Chloroflexota bacterium]
MRREIKFKSEGFTCRGWLYIPDSLKPGTKAPAVVTANAITALQEMIVPVYAERLSAAGFVTLIFDYIHWGASEGEPRNHFAAYTQQQNLRDAIVFLAAQPEVDPERIGGLGVSMGASHMLYLASFERRLKAVSAIAPYINPIAVWEPMLGKPALQGYLAQIGQERGQRMASGDRAIYVPAVGHQGEMAVIPQEEAYDFYMEAQRTVAPNYENRMTLQSAVNMIEYNPDYAIHLAAPTALLIMHAQQDMIPEALVREVFNRAQEPKKMLVPNCRHTDLLSGEPWVTQSATESIAWFKTHLGVTA